MQNGKKTTNNRDPDVRSNPVRKFFEQGRISPGVGQDSSYSAAMERAGGTFVSSSLETLTGPNNRPDDRGSMGRSRTSASF